jgi:hypothetical protein
MAMPDLRRQSASVSPVPLALVERLGRHAECRIRHSKCRFCLIPLVARRPRLGTKTALARWTCTGVRRIICRSARSAPDNNPRRRAPRRRIDLRA